MKTSHQILLVEDSLEVQAIVKSTLGKKFQVTCVTTAEEAVDRLRVQQFSLVILDVGLPGEDGFKLCANIRFEEKYKHISIVFLTGKSQTRDKVLAFSLGADDYVVKPIVPAEFQARIEAKIRRLDEHLEAQNIYWKGPFRVALAEQRIFVDDTRDLGLSSIEFKLFYYFLRHEEHVLSREMILNEVWGPATHVTDRVVDTYVYSLRKKLGHYASVIQSVPRIGYKLSLSETAKVA